MENYDLRIREGALAHAMNLAREDGTNTVDFVLAAAEAFRKFLDAGEPKTPS